MPEYRLAENITIKKGAVMQTPAPLKPEPVQYAHVGQDGYLVSIPLDEALREGLIDQR